MIRKVFIFVLLMIGVCQNTKADSEDILPASGDSLAMLNEYMDLLQKMVDERDSLAVNPYSEAPNAYYYQIIASPTLYYGPLHQMMSYSDSLTADWQIQRIYNVNRALSQLYVEHPQLVWQTDVQIKQQGKFRDDVKDKVESQDKLSEKVNEATLTPDFDAQVEVVTRRPNFWRITGNSSLQFAQNYFSENWYQGGEDSYSGAGTVNLRVNYNDQKKLTWENLLELQLGFQTIKNNKPHAFRPTSNLLRYTTNFGFKAYKDKLYYSGQVRLSTQLVPTYNNNGGVTSDFFSPVDITVAPGMKYSFRWGKKKRFGGTLNVAPLAMNIRHVSRDALTRNYGIDPGHHTKNTFGPNITLDTNWKICNQISWGSRVYWYSNLEFTRIEWTNTVNFQVNKLISTQLNLYPRLDDSNKNYRRKSKHDTYVMFKEWMSMGINYSF